MTVYAGQIESVTVNGRRFDVTSEPSAAAMIAQAGERLGSARFTVSTGRCELSQNQLRWLCTGRSRPRRAETKELNRQARLLRKLLVYDAGTFGASWLWGFGDSTERNMLELANGRRVSVPRSLRGALGRYVGGGR